MHAPDNGELTPFTAVILGSQESMIGPIPHRRFGLPWPHRGKSGQSEYPPPHTPSGPLDLLRPCGFSMSHRYPSLSPQNVLLVSWPCFSAVCPPALSRGWAGRPRIRWGPTGHRSTLLASLHRLLPVRLFLLLLHSTDGETEAQRVHLVSWGSRGRFWK